jgi:hypothetical protein
VYSAPTVYSAPPVYSVTPYAPMIAAPTPTRTPMWVTFIVLALLVGIGAGGGTVYLLRSKSTSTPQAAATTPGATPSPTATGFSGDLKSLLISPPSASQSSAEYESMSLGGVSREFGNPDQALQVLQFNEYQDGTHVSWKEGNRLVVIELYQFATPEEARAYGYYEADISANDDTFLDRSPVAGLDDSALFIAKSADKDKKFVADAFTVRGRISVWVYIEDTKQVDVAIPSDLAQRQHAALPEN